MGTYMSYIVCVNAGTSPTSYIHLTVQCIQPLNKKIKVKL